MGCRPDCSTPLTYRQVEHTHRLVSKALGKDSPDGASSAALQTARDDLLEAVSEQSSAPFSPGRAARAGQRDITSRRMCSRCRAKRWSALLAIWSRGRGSATSTISLTTPGEADSTTTRSAR